MSRSHSKRTAAVVFALACCTLLSLSFASDDSTPTATSPSDTTSTQTMTFQDTVSAVTSTTATINSSLDTNYMGATEPRSDSGRCTFDQSTTVSTINHDKLDEPEANQPEEFTKSDNANETSKGKQGAAQDSDALHDTQIRS